MSSWTVLEIACQEALNEPSISYSFRKKLDETLAARNLPPLDWGQGIWQQVTGLQEIRKNFVHRFSDERDLFPDASVADEAIDTVRRAVRTIFSHAGKVAPNWIQDNTDKGWESAGAKVKASLTVIHAGAEADDPKSIKVVYVNEGKEHIDEILPAGADYMIVVNSLLKNIRIPISWIRVYSESVILFEIELNMRGT